MSGLVILGAKVLKRNVKNGTFLSQHMIPDVVRRTWKFREKNTKENLDFHVQGQIEPTRPF